MSGSVTAILVSYNTASLTVEALRGLRDHAGRHLARTIVVDNASADGSAAAIATACPWVELIELRDNIGFARAVNLAAARATTDHLLLLNPDVVVDSDIVHPLVDFAARHPEGGLWGGRTLEPSGSVDPRSCWGLPTPWSIACFAFGLSTLLKRNRFFDPESLGRWDRDTEREVGMVSGCLLLVRRDLWQQLGGFDERYFVYGEDADLAFRARALGWRPAITPRATIVHYVGASSPTARKRELVMRAKATLVRTHLPLPTLHVGLLVIGTTLRALANPIVGMLRPARRDRSWAPLARQPRTWTGGFPSMGSTATTTPAGPTTRST